MTDQTNPEENVFRPSENPVQQSHVRSVTLADIVAFMRQTGMESYALQLDDKSSRVYLQIRRRNSEEIVTISVPYFELDQSCQPDIQLDAAMQRLAHESTGYQIPH